jgi:hypothetical protein
MPDMAARPCDRLGRPVACFDELVLGLGVAVERVSETARFHARSMPLIAAVAVGCQFRRGPKRGPLSGDAFWSPPRVGVHKRWLVACAGVASGWVDEEGDPLGS